MSESKWRTGRKVGRTIYRMVGDEPSDEDALIGVMDTPELAAQAVQYVNYMVDMFRRAKELERVPPGPPVAVTAFIRRDLKDGDLGGFVNDVVEAFGRLGVSDISALTDADTRTFEVRGLLLP